MSELRRTPLFAHHERLDARFVPFAGWQLPVQFSSIVAEHRAVRSTAGVFDVSHMGRFEVDDANSHQQLQRLLSNDLDRIEPGQAQYTLLTNESGGVVDDLIAYRRDANRYLLVVNAANRDADLARLPPVKDVSEETSMLAVQGPEALQRLELEVAPFTWHEQTVLGVDCVVAGTGYTGEVGCELICAEQTVGALWERILECDVVPCGLGARDTLRLEVCYPLHGQELTPERDPYGAGLGWAVAREKEFVGSEALAAIRERGSTEVLVAFVMRDKGLARAGMPVVDGGVVTSGAYSPMLDVGVGLAYVAEERAEPGNELTVDIRGRHRRAAIVEKPIYRPTRE
ncbi:MAG: glycine cleavage system aminomethyltransferase GcvT [Gaiellaceae bacterium]